MSAEQVRDALRRTIRDLSGTSLGLDLAQAEAVLAAMDVDALALDVFEREVGHALGTHAGIEQAASEAGRHHRETLVRAALANERLDDAGGGHAVRTALSMYPPTFDFLLKAYEPARAGQARLVDIIVGFIDPNAPDVIAQPQNPTKMELAEPEVENEESEEGEDDDDYEMRRQMAEAQIEQVERMVNEIDEVVAGWAVARWRRMAPCTVVKHGSRGAFAIMGGGLLRGTGACRWRRGSGGRAGG